MTKIYLILTLLIFSGLTCLAGEFDTRRDEVLAELTTLNLEKSLDDQVRPKLVDYFSFREKSLQTAYDLLQNYNVGERDQDAKWRQLFQSTLDNSQTLIFSAIGNTPLSPRLAAMRDRLAFQEATFFKRLSRMPLASLRDRIITYRDVFNVESKTLTDRWREICGTEASIDGNARYSQSEFKELYIETAKKVLGATEPIESQIKDIVATVAGGVPADTPDPMNALPAVSNLLDILNATQSTTAGYVDQLLQIASQDERLVIVFTNTRDDVKEFLEKMNLRGLEQERQDGLVEARSIASSSGLTSAQVTEATRFVNRSETLIAGQFEAFNEIYKKFILDFDAIFFNPVGDRTLESLLNVGPWKEWSQAMMGAAIEAAIDDLYHKAENNFGINTHSILDPDVRNKVQSLIQNNMTRLMKALREANDWTRTDRIKFLINVSYQESWLSKLIAKIKSD